MKILYLARHADSGWGDYSMKDFDRPLNDQGLRDAPMMGRILVGMGQTPEVIVTSPAVRAIGTARLLGEAIGLPGSAIVEVGKLYSAPSETILEAVNEIDDAIVRAMVVGHNPGLAQLAGELSRGAIGNMPAGSVASFELPAASWAEVRPGRGRLRFFETPKNRPS